MLRMAALDQPVKQVQREVFRPGKRDLGVAADRRFAGRVVRHAHLRSLLRGRGWSVPALGAWDQGDEATAFRLFEGSLRAELLYQAVRPVPTEMRHECARLMAVRFIFAGLTDDTVQLPLSAVPPRIFSEGIRDVSLGAVVASEGRRWVPPQEP
jgi:hypothetical protein